MSNRYTLYAHFHQCVCFNFIPLRNALYGECFLLTSRLKTELEKLKQKHEEVMTNMKAHYNSDLLAIKEQLSESDSARHHLQDDLVHLRETVDAAKQELKERQDHWENERCKLEKEKNTLENDIAKLIQEVDTVSSTQHLNSPCILFVITEICQYFLVIDCN